MSSYSNGMPLTIDSIRDAMKDVANDTVPSISTTTATTAGPGKVIDWNLINQNFQARKTVDPAAMAPGRIMYRDYVRSMNWNTQIMNEPNAPEVYISPGNPLWERLRPTQDQFVHSRSPLERMVLTMRDRFTRTNKETQVEQTAIATAERPTAEIPKAKVLPSEYAELSGRVGYTFGYVAARTEVLRKFLAEHEIAVYPLDKVNRYLEAKCLEVYNSEAFQARMGRSTMDPPRVYHQWNDIETYSKIIPVEALRVADQIKSGCEFPVEFRVSEIVEYLDPFMFVMASGTNTPFVIAAWDEPGFTMDPRKADGLKTKTV